jgi:sialate O-acetylesterase
VKPAAFASILSEHAVLQCEHPVRIWGQADPTQEVRLAIDGRVVALTHASANGRWDATIPPQSAGGPHVIALPGAGDDVRDIWFGEVWLASGQSNMAWPLADSSDGAEALAKPNPDIHRLRIPGNLQPVGERAWFPADPRWEAGAKGDLSAFSAVAYHFADQVQRRLGCKVGIICSAYGGSAIEAWLPPRAFAGDPARAHLATALEEARELGHPASYWQAELDRFGEWYFAREAWHRNRQGPEPVRPRVHPGNPLCQSSACLLYHAMLRPLIPYTSRGVLWYQGESNVDDPMGYEDLFRRLIAAWREDWQAPDWPFYFVQLAEYGGPGDWDGLREAQTRVRDTVPFTDMAIAFDCGDKNDIHPRNKRPIGERLAAIAFRSLYR